MKKALLIALGIVMSASLALAQPGGMIGLYQDAAGTDCNYEDVAPGLATIYVVHTLVAGATASQFKVQNNGWTATFISFSATPPNLYNPNPDIFSDAAFAYTQCVQGPWLIGSMAWFAGGTGPACASLEVLPANGQTDVLAADCQPSPQFIIGTGGTLTISDDGTCPCEISTEETNWSKIKGLYQ